MNRTFSSSSFFPSSEVDDDDDDEVSEDEFILETETVDDRFLAR
jgi:hypothetical protein